MEEQIFYRCERHGDTVMCMGEFLSPETMLGDWALFDTEEDCMARYAEVNA